MTSPATLADHHQDPDPSEAEAGLALVMAEAQAHLPESTARQQLLVSPITLQLLSGARQRGLKAVLLEHCRGPQPFYAQEFHRRHVATLMDLNLVAFSDNSHHTTELTLSGRATVCKILAGLAEGLLGQAGGG